MVGNQQKNNAVFILAWIRCKDDIFAILADDVDIPPTNNMAKKRGSEQNFGVAAKKQVTKVATKKGTEKTTKRGVIVQKPQEKFIIGGNNTSMVRKATSPDAKGYPIQGL